MRWLRRLLAGMWPHNGTADIRQRAERARDEAQRRRPTVERMAPRIATEPADQFADRVSRAFGRRLT